VGEVGAHAANEVHADVLVHHFTATELQLQLDLHALPHEFLGMTHLHAVVMLVDIHMKIQLLELGRGGIFLRVLFLLGKVVKVLPVIENFADGRVGGGIDLDEIEAAFARLGHGLGESHDAERRGVGVDDDEDFAGANLVVSADEGFVDGDNASQVRVG